MIEKLILEKGLDDERKCLAISGAKKLVDKINEIIDHLSQEKDPFCNDICCVCQKDCKGNRVYDYCLEFVKKEKIDKQPTKEVPDMVAVFDRFTGIAFGRILAGERRKLIDQAIQEISALYRKEKV